MADATPLELAILIWAALGLTFATWMLALAIRRLVARYRDGLDGAGRLMAWERVGALTIDAFCLLAGTWLGLLVSLAPAEPWPPSGPIGAWARDQLRAFALPAILILIGGYTVVAAWLAVSNWRVDRALRGEETRHG